MRSVAIVSGKGGVGKTVTSISLAHSMSKHHKRTLLVDGNLSTPNVHVYLGWPVLKSNLLTVLKDQSSYKDAIYNHPSGLRILPSISSLAEVKNIKHELLNDVIRDLDGHAEIVLLDSAAGIGREAVSAMQSCDEVLIVTNPELGAVLDAQKSVQLAHELGKTLLGVVLTKVRGDKYELSVSDVEKLLDIPVIGVVPFDNAVRKAMSKKSPVTHSHPNSKAAKRYDEIASALLGKRYFEFTGKKQGMREYILRKLGFS